MKGVIVSFRVHEQSCCLRTQPSQGALFSSPEYLTMTLTEMWSRLIFVGRAFIRSPMLGLFCVIPGPRLRRSSKPVFFSVILRTSQFSRLYCANFSVMTRCLAEKHDSAGAIATIRLCHWNRESCRGLHVARKLLRAQLYRTKLRPARS